MLYQANIRQFLKSFRICICTIYCPGKTKTQCIFKENLSLHMFRACRGPPGLDVCFVVLFFSFKPVNTVAIAELRAH